MNKVAQLALFGLLVFSYPVITGADDDNLVCSNIGGLMYGEKTDCKKGDIIMVNPMMAAFVCDMALPTIAGEKLVICHYLGKKRQERAPTKNKN